MEAIDFSLLVIRVVLGVTMIAHGVNHWIGGGKIAGTAGWFGGLGLKFPMMQAWASVVTEIGAGALLILGLLSPLACAAVVSVMLVAGVLAHRPNGFFVFKDGFEYVLVLAAVAIALGGIGPGEVSLDRLLDIDDNLDGWTGIIIAAGVGVVATAGLLAATWRPKPASA